MSFRVGERAAVVADAHPALAAHLDDSRFATRLDDRLSFLASPKPDRWDLST